MVLKDFGLKLPVIYYSSRRFISQFPIIVYSFEFTLRLRNVKKYLQHYSLTVLNIILTLYYLLVFR